MRIHGKKLTKRGILTLIAYALFMVGFVVYETNNDAGFLAIVATIAAACCIPGAIVDSIFVA